MSDNEFRKGGDGSDNDLEIEKVSFSGSDVEEFDVDGAFSDASDAVAAAEDTAGVDVPISEDIIADEDKVIGDDMVDASKYLNSIYEDGDADGSADDDESGVESRGGKRGAKNVGKEILSWILTFLIAFIVAIIINAYFFRVSKVSGDSMLKTFTSGQTVFLSRAPYIFSEPKYGDVVVFDREQVHRNILVEVKESLQYNIITLSITKKSDAHKYWIKRVIGVPGDTIEIKADGVYRNGVLLTENYVNPDEVPNYSRNIGKWEVGEGQLFVMGDNRNHSSDSRVIGLITINSVLGKVLGQ